MSHKVLFKTITGSRLYGLHHDASDYDYYTVVDKVKTAKARYATHKIIGDEDSVVVDFGTWLMMCDKGVPQALEAMFSTQATVDEISAFRSGYRAGSNATVTYLRTMKAMSEGPDDFKHRRHVLRLGENLKDLRRTGRFNPTLDSGMVVFYSTLAEELTMEECYGIAKRVALGLDSVVH